MTVSTRDRRALSWLGVSILVTLLFNFLTPSADTPKVVAPVNSTEPAEKQLDRLRQAASLVPARQEALKAVVAENQLREKGLLAGDTAPQAQAQLLQILRRVARAEAPPIELRSVEIGQARALGDVYGEASVSVAIECKIEQLVNLMAQLTSQPEVLATSDLRVNLANAEEKTLSVRLTVSGVIPKKLVPEKKGLNSF
ncbi:MAG: type II secretion system protein GspM [Bryobacteraceae bacterium]